ncbi:LysR family transcriptional regulator [Nocardia uniformis]|uniref:LysR family transcriptional regulator n=1 Tax=Nocardia uniformis TaxID=53432 RepID=A0A849C5Q9_9NOCA|nr:LysR family transcriptional regulator [Nocardia uniformis]NNH73118.1 LysR family transcriptional regulator [Nocardia uniformis]
MERHEIETFLTLAEELHFARTAERLRLSPGRVSQTIKKLERRIGGPLFERTSRQVALTALGQQFSGELRTGYQQVQQAIHNATTASQSVTGQLRLAFSGPWCGKLMFRAADEFRAEYPRCEVRVREMSLADPIDPLRAGDIDLQLSECPIDEPGITAGPILFSGPPALLVPADHRLAQQESASLEDFAQFPLVTFAGLSPRLYDRHYPRLTPRGTPIQHIPVDMTFHEMLCFVGEGNGMTVLSAHAEKYHTRHDVAYIPLPDAAPVEYGLLWPTGRENATIRAFIRTISRVAHNEPEPR